MPFETTIDLSEATIDGDPGSCWGSARSVWFTITPSSSITALVSLAGGPSDASVSIYVGSPWYLTMCGDPSSAVRIAMNAGTTYWLQVATVASTSTPLSVTQVVGPANDEASGAEVIPALPVVLQPDFTDATAAGEPSVCYGSWYGGLWYRYTPTTTQLVTFELAASATDAAIGLAAGAPPFADVACIGRVSWNPGPMALWLEGGRDYYFLFAAAGVDPNIMLTIDAPTPPANDALADATLVTTLPFAETVSTEAASSEEEAPSGCFGPGADVWYRFVPDRDLTLDIDLSETAGPVGAEVFRVLDSHTEHMGCTDEKFLRQVLDAGQTYLVRVLRLDAPGSMTLAFREGPPPLDITATVAPNGTLDRVAGAVTISGTAWCNLTASDAWVYLMVRQRVGRTTLITGEADRPIACGPGGASWSVKVYGSNGPFGAGSVSVTWSVSAQNAYDYANVTGTTTVRVKGR